MTNPYVGCDAEGRLIPSKSFQNSIVDLYRSKGWPFRRPECWSAPVAKAFDAAPSGESSTPSWMAAELAKTNGATQRFESRESSASDSIRAYAAQFQKWGRRATSDDAEIQKILNRAEQPPRPPRGFDAKSAPPMSDLQHWLREGRRCGGGR